MKKFSLPLILLLLLSACKSEPAIPEFGSLIIDEISELDCDPEEENCAYISINIPWAKERGSRNKRINENIEQHVINLVDFQEKNNFNNLRDLSKSFISNYESSATDFPEYNIPWEASIEGRVLSSNQNLISLEFDLAMFTGGAHGFTSISFLNFEPATGDILSHDDLFSSEFKNYAEEIFRKEYGIRRMILLTVPVIFLKMTPFIYLITSDFWRIRSSLDTMLMKLPPIPKEAYSWRFPWMKEGVL